MADDHSGDLRLIDEETENAVSTAISRYQAFLSESGKDGKTVSQLDKGMIAFQM